MNTTQTTTNPLGVFEKPTKIIISGVSPQELSGARAETFYNFFDKLAPIVKSIKISRIDGKVTALVEIYTPDEQRAQLHNVFKIDVENHCTRCACMDCEYFDHVHLVEINQDDQKSRKKTTRKKDRQKGGRGGGKRRKDQKRRKIAIRK